MSVLNLYHCSRYLLKICSSRTLHVSSIARAGANSERIFALEQNYGANCYAKLPVVLTEGLGCTVYDVEEKRYLDFVAGFSALNLGHCHPKILAAMNHQSKQLTLSSTAFYNDTLGHMLEYVTKAFGYDKFLPMNTGVEAADTSIKLARRWGYTLKKIPDGMAKVVFAEGNYWGSSLAALSASTTPRVYTSFGPLMSGFVKVPYDDLERLEKELKDPQVCAFMIEPIQGESGVIVPHVGYLKKVRELCDQHQVLMIVDEIQTGLGRTGKLLCCDHENVRPDMVCLGRSLSGGVYPCSGVLADNEVLQNLEPGEHSSTFAGNPIAAKVVIAAMEVLFAENLCLNAYNKGHTFRCALKSLPKNVVTDVRGQGLLNAITIGKEYDAWEICLRLMKNGLLTYPAQGNVVRFTPPLVIKDREMNEAVQIIRKTICNYYEEMKHNQ